MTPLECFESPRQQYDQAVEDHRNRSKRLTAVVAAFTVEMQEYLAAGQELACLYARAEVAWELAGRPQVPETAAGSGPSASQERRAGT